MTKKKKIILGVGGGVLALILALGGYVSVLWFSAGSPYEGELEDLVPSDALVVVRLDNLQNNYSRLTRGLDHLVVDREKFRNFESSPLWRSFFLEEGEQGEVPTISGFVQDKLKGGVSEFEAQLATAPVEVDLFADLAGKEAVVSLHSKGGEITPLILSRVSDSMDFYWSFKGHVPDQEGVTINEKGNVLEAKLADGSLWFTLLGDVLVVTPSEAMITDVAELYVGQGKAFSSLEHFVTAKSSAKEALKERNSWLYAYANLEAVRAHQGPDPKDPEKRAGIDQILAVSPEMVSASEEVMENLSTAFSHSIDTRAFDMASWAIDLESTDKFVIDQFLFVNQEKLEKNYSQLLPAWKTAEGSMKILDYLPEKTWMVMANRIPIETVKDSIKPKVGADGKTEQNAVASFLRVLDEANKVDEIGLAFLDQRYGFQPYDNQEHMNKSIPSIFSQIKFPAFALYLHWDGVTNQDAAELMRKCLEDLEVKNVQLSVGNPDFVTFANPNNVATIEWLTQFSCAAIGDYLVFSYSLDHAGILKMIDLSKAPMQAKSFANQISLEDPKRSAFVYFDPRGFARFSSEIRLGNELSLIKFPLDGNVMRKKRLEILAEMNLQEPISPQQDAEVSRRIDAYRLGVESERNAFRARYDANIRSLPFLENFAAQTNTSTEKMHTFFVIQLNN